MLTASEPVRTLLDIGILGLGGAPLMVSSPRGDGHPVLVLPGLLATNRSTQSLRTFLASLGFEVHGWTLGRNLGPRAIGAIGERLEMELDAVFARSGRKVSLIGWSLGGLMARIIAQRAPTKVRQVITMGSGFVGGAGATHAGWLYELVSGQPISAPSSRALAKEAALPSLVPSTSIFAKGDGVVSWQACVGPGSELSESIRVRGSHCGLGFNPAVWFAVADRLAQDENNWRPFVRPPSWSFLFPEP